MMNHKKRTNAFTTHISGYDAAMYFTFGISYLFSFLLYDIILYPTLALLIVRAFRKPDIFDLVLIFIVIDNKSEFVNSAFTPDLISTFVMNFFIVKIVIFQLVSGIKFSDLKFVLLITSALTWATLPLFNTDNLNWYEYFFQMKFILLLLITIAGSGIVMPSEADTERVIYYFLGTLLAFAIFSYQSTGNTFYVSMDSAKSLIILPSLYFIFNKKYIIAIPIILLTLYVLVYFSTRYIFILFSLTLISSLLYYKAYRIIIPGLIAFSLFSIRDIENITFSRFAPLGSFLSWDIFSKEGFYDILSRVDTNRAAEFYYFLEQISFSSMVIGRGFGAYLLNTHGLINEQTIGQFAYSYKEISSGYLFGLHDPFLEFGLSYGFLFLIVLFIGLARVFLTGLQSRNVFLGFYPIAFFTMYWSTKGVLVIGLLTCVVFAQMGKRELQKNNFKHSKFSLK